MVSRRVVVLLYLFGKIWLQELSMLVIQKGVKDLGMYFIQILVQFCVDSIIFGKPWLQVYMQLLRNPVLSLRMLHMHDLGRAHA